MSEALMTIEEYSLKLKVSPHTIYRNPLKYHMFKVGGLWRASNESLEKFSAPNNNVTRLAVVGGKEFKKCRSSKEVKSGGWTSHTQMEKELDALLAPRKKQRHRSITTS